MMPARIRRRVWMVVLIPILLVLASGPAAAAIQLVHMHNGRVLKAQTVERDGDWVMATLGDGATVGVPAEQVDFIEEDPLGREDVGAPANVVTSGREVVRRGAFRGNQANNRGNQANNRGNQAGNRQNPLASQQAVTNPNAGAVANPNAVQPGVAGGRAPGQNVPGSAVEQQPPNSGLNLGSQSTQNPGRSSRFNRLGNNNLRSRSGDN